MESRTKFHILMEYYSEAIKRFIGATFKVKVIDLAKIRVNTEIDEKCLHKNTLALVYGDNWFAAKFEEKGIQFALNTCMPFCDGHRCEELECRTYNKLH